MPVVTRKHLLEAGVHFGHPTKKWDPKMKEYIYQARHGIYIIDLSKTAQLIEVAYQKMLEIAADGGQVIFVGTKKQASDAVYEQALRTNQFYVNQRWIGGTLTNFKTIRKPIKKLNDLEKAESDGSLDVYSKKEKISKLNEKAKLLNIYGGIKDMVRLPKALVVVDPKEEINAVLEARKLGIPVFGIVDTNCDPDLADYIIPANDDAMKSVKLICTVLGNAILEANGEYVEKYTEDGNIIGPNGEIIIVETEEVEVAPNREDANKKRAPRKTTVKATTEESAE